MNKLVIIRTGGTIEEGYCQKKGKLILNHKLLSKYLKSARIPFDTIKIRPVLMKDSLKITKAERELIVKEALLEAQGGVPVIIIHGTDTLSLTGELILETLKNTEDAGPIILTGAMVPLGFEESDAIENMAQSFMAARMLKSGVFCVFHGKLLSFPGVFKNRESLSFERIENA